MGVENSSTYNDFSREHKKNTDFITPDELTQLILEFEDPTSLQLTTMAYQPTDDNAGRIHKHLIETAENGTPVNLGIDFAYRKYFVPHTDYLPIFSPLLIGYEETQKRLTRQRAHMQELDSSKINVQLNGDIFSRHIYPYMKVDHRKMLVARNKSRAFGAIFGCNINYQVNKGFLDSGVYFEDPEILNWMELHMNTPHFTDPQILTFNENITIMTRELGADGNKILDGEIAHAIDSARNDILFISQFLPDGQTLSTLQGALDRGVKVDVVSVSPFFPRQHMYMLHRKIGTRLFKKVCERNPGLTFHTPQDDNAMVHLKGLVIDKDDPFCATAIAGTDCMTNEMLKKIGTREVSVRYDDASTVAGFVSFLQNSILNNCAPFDFSRL